jgi:uncharacterized phage protein (TIGR02218 family)
MKTIPEALGQHLAGEATTLCRCWKLLRADGVELGFTDHDRDIEFGGVLFEAKSGADGSEIESMLGFARDSQEITGAISSARISAEEIRAGRYDGARIELWLVNWSDWSQRLLDRSFSLGAISGEDNRFRVELTGASPQFSAIRGRRFQRLCDADLGDSRCGVDLSGAGMWGEAQIVAVPSSLIVAADGLAGFEPGWFRGGGARFSGGANDGVKVGIAEHLAHGDGVRLHLWNAPPFAPAVGDLIVVTAGCDKSFAQCRDRFANSAAFRGFPHMPGNDFALGHAASFDVMDGGALTS